MSSFRGFLKLFFRIGIKAKDATRVHAIQSSGRVRHAIDDILLLRLNAKPAADTPAAQRVNSSSLNAYGFLQFRGLHASLQSFQMSQPEAEEPPSSNSREAPTSVSNEENAAAAPVEKVEGEAASSNPDATQDVDDTAAKKPVTSNKAALLPGMPFVHRSAQVPVVGESLSIHGLIKEMTDRVRRRLFEEAIQIYREWLQCLDPITGKPNKPLVTPCNIELLAEGLKGAPVDLLLKRVQEMGRLGIAPNTDTFYVLFNEAADVKDMGAFDHLFKIVQDLGIPVQAEWCIKAIGGLRSDADVLKAMDYVRIMVTNNLSPDDLCLSRLVSAFSRIGQAQKDRNRCVFPDIFLEHYISGVQILPGLSHQNSSLHSYLHTFTFPKGESMHADSNTYILQASRLAQNLGFKKAGACAGVQKLSHRLIQTHSGSTWDHPWSRDELAERMPFLKERRMGKARLKERLGRRVAFSQYTSCMPLPSQPLGGVLQPRTPEHNLGIKKAGACAGVQKLSHRLIQTLSESTWDHPWSRDELAERMSFLKERRMGKARLKERFRRRVAFSQDSSCFPGMPLPSQPLEGVLQPRTPEDAKVAPLLAHADLIITRNIEWANLLVGFEQENRYVIMDPRESLSVVGFIVESSNWLSRQFLRSRRPFIASIMDAADNVLFTVRRPIWFINSTIYAEINGEVVGFAKRRWHLWRRIYDVYLGKRQFAVVENPGFWNWTFTLKDENGSALAEIDRHFRGFGFELLTDAGQYALRFGDVASEYHPQTKAKKLTAKKTAASRFQGIKVNPEAEAEQFISQRPLNLLERTVTLALAISLDNDYFSRHHGFFPFPFGSEE